MAELVSWLLEEERHPKLHPLLTIGVFIVVLLAIHPFQDGNGRLSRGLTTLLLLRAGYAYVPFVSLERVVEQTREAYYRALRTTQTSLGTTAPDWSAWITYFLGTLQGQKRRLARQLEREEQLLARLPELSLRLLELIRQRGRLTLAEAVRATGANCNTLKGHFRALVENGDLQLHGAGRGAWYGPG